MSAQHTPGPWRVSEGLNAGFVAKEQGGFVPIRTPFRHDAFQDGPSRSDISDEILGANARLIAAAPELLEACKATQFSFEKIRNSGEGYAAALKRFLSAKRLARLAIAKAEGRQP